MSITPMTTRDPPKRRIKETLFTRHRSTVESLMIAKDWKATLQAIHTISEKELTRRERTTLAQLRSGDCILLDSYKSIISKGASLDVCADCGKAPHDVKHLFNCPAHPTTNDTIGLMEQTSGRNPGTQLSRGKSTRLR